MVSLLSPIRWLAFHLFLSADTPQKQTNKINSNNKRRRNEERNDFFFAFSSNTASALFKHQVTYLLTCLLLVCINIKMLIPLTVNILNMGLIPYEVYSSV